MKFELAASAACLALAVSASHAQSLADPGFEGTLSFDGAPFDDAWEGFFGTFSDPAGMPFSRYGSTMPLGGSQALEVGVDSDASFAGAFTQVNGLAPGQVVDFFVFAKSPSPSVLTAEVQLRIEFFDSSDTFVDQTGNLTPVITGDYLEYMQTGVVPLGADRARFVIALDSGGDFRGDNGTVYFDNASIVVPEPTSLALLGVGGLAMLRRRR